MPIKNDNIYNIDKKFDYFTIKAMVIESLQKILLAAKQEQEQGQQQQQTITFDYNALVREEGDDNDDDHNQDELNQDEEIRLYQTFQSHHVVPVFYHIEE